ncbi:hypothetical protein D3C85_1303580 [compost metagenome]
MYEQLGEVDGESFLGKATGVPDDVPVQEFKPVQVDARALLQAIDYALVRDMNAAEVRPTQDVRREAIVDYCKQIGVPAVIEADFEQDKYLTQGW